MSGIVEVTLSSYPMISFFWAGVRASLPVSGKCGVNSVGSVQYEPGWSTVDLLSTMPSDCAAIVYRCSGNVGPYIDVKKWSASTNRSASAQYAGSDLRSNCV